MNAVRTYVSINPMLKTKNLSEIISLESYLLNLKLIILSWTIQGNLGFFYVNQSMNCI